MNIPGKGMGYYSFPKNDVVYGSKVLERPKYDFPRMNAAQYQMPNTPPANFQGKPINYQPGTANINFGNTTSQPKKFSPEPTQLINNIGASYKDPVSLNASNGNLPIPKYSMANTMEKVGATNKPFVTPTPNYTSIVDLLKSRKQDSSFSNRKKLAEEMGIKNYTGSASQNMEFIRRINNNKTSGAGMTSPSQMQNQEVMNPNNPVQLKNVPFIYKRPQVQPQSQPQQGNKPFYGPGNTLIGSTDDNRQFYPGKYTGAPNNQSNLQDKELLANSEKLKQYVQSKDNYKFELGGVNIHPAMRTYFKQGGYYGMDGRLHRAKGSGTYVMNGGYYFEPGGIVDDENANVASPDTPPGAIGNPAAVPQSSLVDNMPYEDYSFDMGTDETGNSSTGQQPMGQQPMIDPYDPSKYSSSIDPDTGFTTWSKNNQQLTNIKKQDPALWNNLKNEGKGARFRTGQTDIQKFGRAAGKFANNLEMGINIASGIGNIINNRNEQRNLNNSAINKGSTASLYTNPQSAGKGTGFGQTGSSYGMMDPSSIGARSFTGMYGKYGMQVPKFQPGGGFSNLFSSAQSVLPVSSPIDLMPNISFSKLTVPVADNTVVYRTNQNNQEVDNTQQNNNTPIVNKRGGTDVATRLNNPRNLIYTPVFSKLFGAKKSSTKQTDGSGYFAEFPTIEAGLKAAETQLFGEVDGIFQSSFYNPDTDIHRALKTWSGGLNKDGTINSKGYGVEIYPELKGKTLSQITAAQRRELQRRQIKAESAAMYRVLEDNGVFNNSNRTNNYMPNYNYASNTTVNTPKPAANNYAPNNTNFSLKSLIDFAKANKFDVTSTTGGGHNVGSKHYKGRAIDVRTKNKTPEQINQFMALARKAGFRVLDERVRPKGQKKWDGEHLHLELMKKGGQFGGQVMEMDENEIKQFLKAGGQLEFLD